MLPLSLVKKMPLKQEIILLKVHEYCKSNFIIDTRKQDIKLE